MIIQTKDDQKELFIVVDENDNIIDYRTRYDCHHDPKLIHRAVGIILYNDKQEILLQKRSVFKDTNPGWYEIATGGHVAKGESYEQAAARELNEELGIQVPLTFIKKYLEHFPNETEMNALFQGHTNGPFYPNPDEVAEVLFVTKEKLTSMKGKLTPFAKRALQEVGMLEPSK